MFTCMRQWAHTQFGTLICTYECGFFACVFCVCFSFSVCVCDGTCVVPQPVTWVVAPPRIDVNSDSKTGWFVVRLPRSTYETDLAAADGCTSKWRCRGV
jgi:hypothetical protein